MKTTIKEKTVQEVQDNIFRKMPVGKKIRLASKFFSFAKKLNKTLNQNGTRRTAVSHRKYAK
ncbi:MAG: hypothetical protein Q8L09_04595 [Candidatus Moranbacteria bacterium]|nr:hypothetical protein [Candidatus Moranbacteria bacterium]